MILFLTHTRDQAAATARLLEAEELSYSLIDIEQLEVDNFNTSFYWDTPTYTAPVEKCQNRDGSQTVHFQPQQLPHRLLSNDPILSFS